MSVVLSIIAVIVLAGALLFAADNKPAPVEKKVTTICTGKEVTAKGIKSMQKCEIEDMLRNLEAQPEPKVVKNAMCYDPAMPQALDYVCPKCGQRTKYSSDYHFLLSTPISETINFFNGLFAESKLKMSLDTSTLCAKCNPNAKEHGVFLVITYADGTTTRSSISNKGDFYILSSFLDGLLVNDFTKHGDVEPLKLDIDRLRELLGLPKAEEKKE